MEATTNLTVLASFVPTARYHQHQHHCVFIKFWSRIRCLFSFLRRRFSTFPPGPSSGNSDLSSNFHNQDGYSSSGRARTGGWSLRKFIPTRTVFGGHEDRVPALAQIVSYMRVWGQKELWCHGVRLLTSKSRKRPSCSCTFWDSLGHVRRGLVCK